MPHKTEPQTQAGKEPAFHAMLYRGEIARTLAGSPILKITPLGEERIGPYRRLAAVVYELAAELERRSEAAGARWVVTPEALSGRIILELVRDEAGKADQILEELMADFNLARAGDTGSL